MITILNDKIRKSETTLEEDFIGLKFSQFNEKPETLNIRKNKSMFKHTFIDFWK